MNVEILIRTSLDGSPGFSRIRRSRQYAAAPAGIPPAEAGIPVNCVSGPIFSTFIKRHYDYAGVRALSTQRRQQFSAVVRRGWFLHKIIAKV